MVSSLLPLLAVALTLVLPSSAAVAVSSPSDSNLTAYQALQTFDFPVGILPVGALGYELDRSTGAFKAFLNGSCEFNIQSYYQLRYKSTIAGKITKDRLSNLSGVSVKILFLWLNIVEVSRDGDQLYFSVGIASASFGIDNFYESPQCGCGFDCNSLRINQKVAGATAKLRLPF
ncbi:hypothetical protein LUZ61_000091 [Rhynchospora tenuis]|uniref:DUF3575 domain-containing protein n=1 Tax=Rhynchospora tenuis TaxID=198213 RepID=A0AAD6EPC3_9POAL|nr:hypothetical protein LUZ61_020982 [Rhynchospora tenuis]KAJ3696386.1 hypothetical protein LUZ61_000091 [Rhynchospora tenuis]